MHRPTRRGASLVVAIVCSSTALVLFAPASAFADDPLVENVDVALDDPLVEDVDADLNGTVDDATEVVGDPVDDATEVVGDPVDDASEVVGDPVDDAAEVVGDPVDEVTDPVADPISDANGLATTAGDGVVATSNDAAGQIGQTSNQSAGHSPTGPAGGSGGEARDAFVDDAEGKNGGATRQRERDAQPGEAEGWVWKPSDRLQLVRANGSGNVPAVVVATAGEDADPCRDDASLVCLGLLYEIGRYARSLSAVFGVVATTGVGIIGLMAIALALGTTGSAALVASRGRSAAALRG
jgi:hypothetical protein